MTLRASFKLTLWTCTLPLTLAGCPDKTEPGDTDTSAGPSSGSSTADATTVGDATTQTPSTTTGPTTLEPTTAGSTAAEPEVTSSGGETDGTVPEGVCQQVCEHLVECGSPFAPDVPTCVQSCQESPYKNTAGCIAAAQGWWECLGERPCDEVQEPAPPACELPYANYIFTCADCYAEPQEGPPGACIVINECPDAIAVAYTCMEDTCVCQFVGEDAPEEPYATCPATDVCAAEPADQLAAASACCGVPFTNPFL